MNFLKCFWALLKELKVFWTIKYNKLRIAVWARSLPVTMLDPATCSGLNCPQQLLRNCWNLLFSTILWCWYNSHPHFYGEFFPLSVEEITETQKWSSQRWFYWPFLQPPPCHSLTKVQLLSGRGSLGNILDPETLGFPMRCQWLPSKAYQEPSWNWKSWVYVQLQGERRHISGSCSNVLSESIYYRSRACARVCGGEGSRKWGLALDWMLSSESKGL